jgi:hypothetical protein
MHKHFVRRPPLSTGISINGQNLAITFTTLTNRAYELQRPDDLSSNS